VWLNKHVELIIRIDSQIKLLEVRFQHFAELYNYFVQFSEGKDEKKKLEFNQEVYIR
jgi:hypothetical protein